MNGKRASRSHRVGPGGIRCVCCRPANKALSKRIAAREQRRIARAELAALEVDATHSASDEQSLSAYIEDLHESLVGVVAPSPPSFQRRARVVRIVERGAA